MKKIASVVAGVVALVGSFFPVAKGEESVHFTNTTVDQVRQDAPVFLDMSNVMQADGGQMVAGHYSHSSHSSHSSHRSHYSHYSSRY